MARQALPEIQVKPPVVVSVEDHGRLCELAEASLARMPSDDAWLLLDEVGRADMRPAAAMPPDIVAMHSHVEYRDERNGVIRRVQLVYPGEASVRAGKISVLSLIGAALIGLAEGQSIRLGTHDRGERQFTVLSVAAAHLADDAREDESRVLRKTPGKKRRRARSRRRRDWPDVPRNGERAGRSGAESPA